MFSMLPGSQLFPFVTPAKIATAVKRPGLEKWQGLKEEVEKVTPND